MSEPYTDPEVNATIAATIEDLQSQLTAFQTATQSLAGQLADAQLQLTAANARVAAMLTQRDEAVHMLAEWCVMVQINGSGTTGTRDTKTLPIDHAESAN